MAHNRYLLLSAYACEPDRGSEPGVGYSWLAKLLQRGVGIVLLTRANNVLALEERLSAYIETGQLVIHGVDVEVLLPMKRAGLLPVQLYYVFWQAAAYRWTRRTRQAGRINIALAWHLTFGVCRFPTFLPLLPVDCVIGPVGGAEAMPFRFLPHVGLFGAFAEVLRAALNSLTRINLLDRIVYRKAKLVLFKTPDTARVLQEYCRSSQVRFEIGTGMTASPAREGRSLPRESKPLKFLYVGRLLHWKGIRLLCQAFASARSAGVAAELHLIGTGPEEKYIRRFARSRHLDEAIFLHGNVPHQVARSEMASADLVLLPSFHDSSGNVVVESLDAGIPILALDLGGPSALLGSDYSGLIPARGRRYADVVADYAGAMIRFSRSDDYRRALVDETRTVRASRSFDDNFSDLLRLPVFHGLASAPVVEHNPAARVAPGTEK